MAGVLLPACAIFFSGLLIFIYFSKQRVNLLENKMYAVMILSILFDSILVTILQLFPLNGVSDLELTFVPLLNKIDFIFLILFCNCLFFYTTLITIPKFKEKFKIYRIPFAIIDLLTVALILFSPISVINQGENYSVGGLSVYLVYILCLLYIMLSISIVLFNLKKIDRRHIPIFAIILIMIFIFILFQQNPYLIVISIALTFINYIMYFTIENPDLNHIKELNLAKDQAEKANRAKTDFLSNMSHEIRTPLNAIVGFSECMLETNDLKETKEYSQDIVDASKQLLEIVNGILDISKIEANKVEIIPKNYNPREVFDGLRKLVLPRIKEKPIEFKMVFSPDLPGILRGDVSKVKQVILNILTNAAKYTDKGEIVFNVNCINRLDTKTCLMYISVKDTGHGIKKEKLETIFGKFERIDEDKNTTTEGTGLGLAITKSLVDLMGGRITVFSKYGEGSTFRVYLEQEIVSMEVPKTEEDEEDEINYTNYNGKKILIVDDSKINLKVAETLMKPYNFEIDTAISGFEALEKVNDKNYDLIFMDIMMPKMNGVETLYKLREHEDFTTPVIALTADAIEGTDEKYLNVGFNSYLSKPIDRKLLNKVINKYLGGK